MFKSIQQTLILALCVLVPSLARGAALSEDKAKNVAAEFFQSGEIHRLADKGALTLAQTVTDASGNPVCYIFNATDGNGFIIISADDTALPVIGYSASSAWNNKAVPAAATNVLSVATPMPRIDLGPVFRAPSKAAAESKILATPTWSQEAPFNNNIPNRRLTGCVGVALAEILKYHQFPAARPSSLVKSDEATAYAWETMRNDNYRSGYTNEEADAVATLVADAAISIGTDFGMSSSSAFEVKVPFALVSMLGYDAGVSYKKRSEMTKDAWEALITNEIDESRPVLYSGQDVSSGHAFVCDGYEMRGGIPYFHINWGWGGSANGFFASDALNPVVSRAHSYNDLTTVIYNIKPAENNTEWSPIHITSDERQSGLTLDVTDIPAGGTFTARAGALKNISNTDFSGKLAIALFDAAGRQKCLLNEGRNFNLIALQTLKYVDFSCQLPSGTSVADGDVVRLVTMASGATTWLPVTGDLLAPGEVAAKGWTIPYFNVALPGAGDGYEIPEAETRVIKGRDYSFKVIPTNVDKVVTVKANGFILSPDANNYYKIVNVLQDQDIDIIVQNAADVLTKSVLWVTAGNLENLLDEKETATITDLTLFGTMNANDFTFIRDRMKLNRLDISQVNIIASGSNPANAIPTKAFINYRSLKQIILPNNLTTFKNGCLAQTGLTSIEIPASVATWEYNVFLGCNALREVIVRRSSPAWINWCVFNGTPQTKLVVPVGATSAYKSKEYWQDFKEIVEEDPVAADHFTLTVAEKKGLKFTYLTEGTEFSKGDAYEFRVETDDSFQDAVMQVYSNATCLTPDANGTYRATINGNTLIHVEFKEPQPTTVDTTWKLTGDVGGIGLASEVVNVPVNKTFVVRANAIKVPKGDDAAKFYGMVLTDKNGAIKEFISSIISNYYSRTGENLTFNFYCQVKEAQVKEGNQIRLATSYNKKDWQLVEAEADSITDRLEAISNPVVYHNVTMPSSVTGAKIEGATTQVVRGMPFSIKASAIDPAQRVTVSVNGETKATNVAVANVSIPAVLEDLDITVTVKDAAAGDYMVFNIQEGLLASKLVDCPERVKLIGTMLVSDFDALRANASVIIDLDMADVTIKGAAMTGNSIPENAFAPTSASSLSALTTVILPNNLERINKNAFARCTKISEITIPANVNYIGDGAFSACVGLKKIIAKPKVAPTCGSLSPFPSNPSQISLEVPKGSEESYSVPSTWWEKLTLYQAPADQKNYYWVKYDSSRALKNGYSGDLNRIAVGADNVEFMLYLPNYQQASSNNNSYIRPNVAFKLYDNDVDVFANLNAYHYEPQSYYRVWPEQNVNMTGGQLALRWVPSATAGPWMPQNHNVEIYFYYSINFENKEGADGVQATMVEVPEGCEWKNVQMKYFNINSTEVKPVLYREGSEIKFQLSNAAPKTELVVNLMTKVMTKPGKSPVYEEREMELESNNGIYTIPALQGDTWIRISGITHYEEGDPIPAEDLSTIKKEDVLSYSELTVTGEMSDEDFETIRDLFDSVESLDLTDLENETIPEGAFEGMDQLKDVIVSETVTEIGANAFKDCGNIESLTLPGVTSIGEGAFEGCENLTSILLPSLGSAEASAQSGMRKAPQVDGVSVESFRGLNPNCLIYVGSVDIPDAESLNIILNIDGQRVAASDINLNGNHSFNAPASFMLGEHKISFTADIAASDSCDVDGGWTTLMLPFRPTGMEFGQQLSEREGSGLHIISFDGEDAGVMTNQSEILPNHPYLANVCAPFASVPVTFFATAREQDDEIVYDIPFTPVPEALVAVGKDFSLYGSYDGASRHVTSYVLNDEGSAFICPVDQDSVNIRPFDAYLSPNEGTTATEFAIGEHPLWIKEPVPASAIGTHLYRSSKIELASPSIRGSIFYTVDGSDPTIADGTRKLYEAPITMNSETMTIRAVAEHKGYRSDVVTLNYELRRTDLDYTLAQNWNWISHNMEDAVAVSDFATEGISRIVSQTEEVVRDPKFGLVGTLKSLDPVTGYKACVSGEGWTGKVTGVAHDPSTPVKLHRGWNWIGCPLDNDESLLINDLFSALEVEEGEMIVGLDGFEQVDAEGVWKGTLGSLVPGNGYMFFSNSDKEFVYTISTPAEEEDQTAKAPRAEGRWIADIHKYPSVMPVTASLTTPDGMALDASAYEIAAFCGEECRGTGMMVDGYVMINVHGNAGDHISFRFMTPDNEEIISESAISFNEMPAGTMSDPFLITAGGTTVIRDIENGAYAVVSENGSIVLKGDASSVTYIEVYDLSGTRIAVADATGGGTITSGKLETGVFIVVLHTPDSSEYLKVLVK